MKKNFFPFLGACVAAFMIFIVAQGVADRYIEFLKDEDGVILSSEIVGIKYVAPVVLSLLCGYICFKLQKIK